MNRIINIVTTSFFIVGTIIFMLYLWTSSAECLFLGYAFIVTALLTNFTVYIWSVISNRKSNNKVKPQKLLLNIPVAIVYMVIAIYWANIVRIKVVNDTKVNVQNFQVIGCDDQTISQLKPGESETMWINPSGDCVLTISFMRGKDLVSIPGTYFTTNLGQKMTFRCSDDNFNW
jgi:hypothetical protein